MADNVKKPRTFGQWLVLVAVALGGAAAILWRFVWPVTGIEADLIFIAVMVAGVIAARLARWF